LILIYGDGKRHFASCVLVNDQSSWVGAGLGGSTAVVARRQTFVANQRRLGGKAAAPKPVCIDIQPYLTSQASDHSNILNVGGFSDAVFSVVSRGSGRRWRLVCGRGREGRVVLKRPGSHFVGRGSLLLVPADAHFPAYSGGA